MTRPLGKSVFLIGLIALSACATKPKVELTCRADSEENYHAQCGAIRTEIARLRTKLEEAKRPPDRVNPQVAQAIAGDAAWIATSSQLARPFSSWFEASAPRKIAELEQCAAELQCGAAFSSAPSPWSFDKCFAKCKDMTGRDDAACFDACAK